MVKALYLDFYGTVVQEADGLIPIICKEIQIGSELHTETSTRQIEEYWLNALFGLFDQSYGEKFKTQSDLELISILSHFASKADPIALSQILLDHWRSPAI